MRAQQARQKLRQALLQLPPGSLALQLGEQLAQNWLRQGRQHPPAGATTTIQVEESCSNGSGFRVLGSRLA